MGDINIAAMVQPIPLNNRFIDSSYNIWCGSVTKGENGKFYMLYSRWPKHTGHNGWINFSEIALARADKPNGPYKHIKVIFSARGENYWDGACTHNPAVIQYKGKYYMFYMGANGSAEINKLSNQFGEEAWWARRNSQRIGLAVADDPEGEWQRRDEPILNVSLDSTAYDAMLVSNPAPTVDDKGRVILLYKQVEKNGTMKGGKVRFGVAFASSLTGPYIKHSKPIFGSADAGKEWMVAEDPYIWHYKGTNYAIVRDVIGKFTGDKGALALMTSANGYDWQPAKHPKVIGSRIYFEDGTIAKDHLERPCLYLEKGVPRFLFGAMGLDPSRSHSMNVCVPLKQE